MIQLQKTCRFALAAGVVAAVILLIGVAVAGRGGEAGVWAGVILAYLFQVFAIGVMTGLFPTHRFLVFGAGMVGRLAVMGFVAFILIPNTGVDALPTLVSLVSVFFATTLLEPVFLHSGSLES